MEIGLRLRGGAQSPVSLAHVVLEAERAGLEFVCVADDLRSSDVGIGFPSSVWPSLGAVAVATRRIRVQIDGISITGSMHPASVAHLAMSAAAMLSGRFTVGFSAGSSRAVTGRAHPARPVRLRALAEGIDVFRRLTAGEAVDQSDTGIVINDLRLPGGSSAPISVSLTATEETEASLAAELACNLVVPLGADITRVVAAYQAAGGRGEVSAPLLLADHSDPKSIDIARAMLLDRAVLDDAREAGIADPAPLSDDDVAARWLDVAEPSRVSDAMAQLSELGVRRLELMSPSHDPHLAIRQWREYNGAHDPAAVSPQPLVGQMPAPVASAALIDVGTDRAAVGPTADPGQPPAGSLDTGASPADPPDRVSLSPVPELPSNDDEPVADLMADRSRAATPPDDGPRDALEVASGAFDDESADKTAGDWAADASAGDPSAGETAGDRAGDESAGETADDWAANESAGDWADETAGDWAAGESDDRADGAAADASAGDGAANESAGDWADETAGDWAADESDDRADGAATDASAGDWADETAGDRAADESDDRADGAATDASADETAGDWAAGESDDRADGAAADASAGDGAANETAGDWADETAGDWAAGESDDSADETAGDWAADESDDGAADASAGDRADDAVSAPDAAREPRLADRPES